MSDFSVLTKALATFEEIALRHHALALHQANWPVVSMPGTSTIRVQDKPFALQVAI